MNLSKGSFITFEEDLVKTFSFHQIMAGVQFAAAFYLKAGSNFFLNTIRTEDTDKMLLLWKPWLSDLTAIHREFDRQRVLAIFFKSHFGTEPIKLKIALETTRRLCFLSYGFTRTHAYVASKTPAWPVLVMHQTWHAFGQSDWLVRTVSTAPTINAITEEYDVTSGVSTNSID